MDVIRWTAWLGVAAAPIAAWMCWSAAATAATDLGSHFTVDTSVVLGASAVGAISASYLSILSTVIMAVALMRKDVSALPLTRVTPRMWRSLLTTALGSSLALGITVPALATEPPDATQLGWLTAPTSAKGVAETTLEASRATDFTELPTPGADTHRAESGPAIEPELTSTERASVPSASVTTASTTPHDSGASAGAGHGGVYIVQRGDSLWRIAARLLGPGASAKDVADAWPKLYEANRGVVGGNPSLIFAGQELQIPRSLA